MLPSIVDNDVSPSVEPSSRSLRPRTPVKASIPDMLAASDTNRVGDQAFAVAETSLPASGGVANPPATNAAFSDTATSNSLEDGFITLDDALLPRSGLAPRRRTTRASKQWKALNWIEVFG